MRAGPPPPPPPPVYPERKQTESIPGGAHRMLHGLLVDSQSSEREQSGNTRTGASGSPVKHEAFGFLLASLDAAVRPRPVTRIITHKISKGVDSLQKDRDPLDAPAVIIIGAMLLFLGVLLNVVEML
ncbi:hypothetical protein M446_1862 [Methylobacterium sp. 4-46]|nr:hypothetical protein M446_1862 [Methylobacterium sp. 4-46]